LPCQNFVKKDLPRPIKNYSITGNKVAGILNGYKLPYETKIGKPREIHFFVKCSYTSLEI